MKLTRKQFFVKLGEEVAEKIRKRTKQGKDVRLKKFKKLSDGYIISKGKGGGKRQSSKKTSPTDLQFTGDMLRDLQVRSAGDDFVDIGWQGTFAERVEHNEKNKRFMSTQKMPLSKSEQAYVDKRIDQELEENLDAEAKKGEKKVLRLNIF